MIVPTRTLFEHAYGNYALGAYNINNLEQAMGLFRGCIDSQAPFIIQISKGARAYTDKPMLEAMIRAADKIFPEALFAVHLDHGDEATAMECIASGFYSSVMIDASHEPFEENVAITKRVVDAAHENGISVEAELGMLGGVEEDIKVDEKNACLTDPEEAYDFVQQSGCDWLACAIGTSHGAYKFSGGQGIHFDRVRAIQEKLPGFPLVMHGSVLGSAGRGTSHQRGGRSAERGREGRGPGAVSSRRQTGRLQSQHRHGRAPGLDARSPRVLPRQARRIRPAPAR